MLLAIPADRRTGSIFPLIGLKGELLVDGQHISRVICMIGKAAGVVVDKASGKFASAHDLRRAFGVRWASRVMPADVMKLMRHADISTTMKYYAGHGVETTEDAVYAALARVNVIVNSQATSVQNVAKLQVADSIASTT
jgi:integrase